MSTDITMDHEHVRPASIHAGYHCATTDPSLSHAACHNDVCLLLNSPSASTSLCSQLSDDHVCTYEEYEAGMHQRRSLMSADELPAFNIQSMSPHSRSLSPIDFNNDDDELLTFSMSPCGSSDGPDPTDDVAYSMADDAECMGDVCEDHDGSHVSVDQINALIGTPPPAAGKRLNLETIFEGVFLHTPPRKSRRESLLAQQCCKEFVEDQRHHMQPRLDMVDIDSDFVEG